MSKILFFIFLVLNPSLLQNKGYFSYVIFWNTGQGQWVTAVTPDQCLHFDFGGETPFWKKNESLFLQTCQFRQNVLFLSHPDHDHYAFIIFMRQKIPNLCWGTLDHPFLKKLHFKLPYCGYFQNEPDLVFRPTVFKTTNESSRVYDYQKIIIPGDSPIKEEKIWASLAPQDVEFLSLGHHGSRTSTSEFLLAHLKNVKQAFAQSRFKKYGHPHKETLEHLAKYHIPLIKTEDWGNVILDLK